MLSHHMIGYLYSHLHIVLQMNPLLETKSVLLISPIGAAEYLTGSWNIRAHRAINLLQSNPTPRPSYKGYRDKTSRFCFWPVGTSTGKKTNDTWLLEHIRCVAQIYTSAVMTKITFANQLRWGFEITLRRWMETCQTTHSSTLSCPTSYYRVGNYIVQNLWPA